MKSLMKIDRAIDPTSCQPSPTQRISALILCAGMGRRTGLEYNKIMHMFGKKSAILMVLDSFLASMVTDITLVISPNDEEELRELVIGYDVSFCYGGRTRNLSVKNGLNNLKNCDIVVIHDGARPFVSPQLINDCIKSACLFGSGIAALPATDTLKTVKNGIICGEIDRSTTYNIQTPQAFCFEKILNAYNNSHDPDCTDDSQLYCSLGHSAHIVEGSSENIKITSPADLYSIRGKDTVVGLGFDVHRLEVDRKLILGGIEIPFDKGLLGHSDADVLVHAIMDALLSASNQPDIGVLFPDSDNRYKDICSLFLLKRVNDLLQAQGLCIRNISAVIIAHSPRLAPFIDNMRAKLASTLSINATMINISATTSENLGITSEGNGIAASAVCLLSQN